MIKCVSACLFSVCFVVSSTWAAAQLIWEKHPEPLIVPGDGNLPGEDTVRSPSIVEMGDGTYRIYYGVGDLNGPGRVGGISMATAPVNDPRNLTQYPRNPIRTGISGDGAFPFVVRLTDTQWRMYIGAGLYTSSDGINWIPYGTVLFPKAPENGIGSCCVIFDGDHWKMYYTSIRLDAGLPDGREVHVALAVSDNGLNFQQSEANPLFPVRKNDNPDGYEHINSKPFVLIDNDRYRMWYNEQTINRPYRIRYAESSDGVNWVRMFGSEGIDVSATGWDAGMIEYPFVIRHGARYRMWYTGNHYGYDGYGLPTGIGLAEARPESRITPRNWLFY